MNNIICSQWIYLGLCGRSNIMFSITNVLWICFEPHYWILFGSIWTSKIRINLIWSNQIHLQYLSYYFWSGDKCTFAAAIKRLCTNSNLSLWEIQLDNYWNRNIQNQKKDSYYFEPWSIPVNFNVWKDNKCMLISNVHFPLSAFNIDIEFVQLCVHVIQCFT